MANIREPINDYFMKICETVASRSTCLHRKVGAIIVRDGMILSTGYNGAPRKIQNCIDTGFCHKNSNKSGEDNLRCIAAHAEANAIAQAARNGININNSNIYCTNFPCVSCVKLIIQSGIINVFYKEDYDDGLNKSLINKSMLACSKIQKGI